MNKENKDILKEFMSFSLEYNKKINITGIRDEKLFWIKQVEDSLKILDFFDLENKNILDLGTGGGIPGIPLAIFSKTSKVTLLDSNNKKTKFCELVCDHLGLKNVSFINKRIEESTELKESFDIIVAKAIAPLAILLEIASFACGLNGRIILHKGPNINTELNWKKEDLELLGLEYEGTQKYVLDDEIERNLISFIKTSETNEIYPRRYSEILKNPIF